MRRRRTWDPEQGWLPFEELPEIMQAAERELRRRRMERRRRGVSLGELFRRVVCALRGEADECNPTEALILSLLVGGGWSSTASVARRTGKGIRQEFMVLRKLRMRGLVESRMETRCDGNWWRITWRGEEALRRIFERIKDGSMM